MAQLVTCRNFLSNIENDFYQKIVNKLTDIVKIKIEIMIIFNSLFIVLVLFRIQKNFLGSLFKNLLLKSITIFR